MASSPESSNRSRSASSSPPPLVTMEELYMNDGMPSPRPSSPESSPPQSPSPTDINLEEIEQDPDQKYRSSLISDIRKLLKLRIKEEKRNKGTKLKYPTISPPSSHHRRVANFLPDYFFERIHNLRENAFQRYADLIHERVNQELDERPRVLFGSNDL